MPPAIQREVKSPLFVMIGESHFSPVFDSSDASPLTGGKFDPPPLGEFMNRIRCDLRPLHAAEGQSFRGPGSMFQPCGNTRIPCIPRQAINSVFHDFYRFD
jgi:hypothetical protein